MDLFEKEQYIYDKAMENVSDACADSSCYSERYEALLREYGELLRRFRKVTKFFDITVGDFLDMADKIHYDTLTGIHNRHFLEANLMKNIKKLSRSGSTMSLLFLDVDFFKQYNDKYGHIAGDNCLVSIAGTLLSCVTRENDIVARYGGEEFCIVLPHTNERGAYLVAHRVLKKMKERNLPHEASSVADYVTISIGGTTIKVNHTHKTSDYIERADQALYMSKQNGRNRYTYLTFKDAEEEKTEFKPCSEQD